ncbi:hypothetical protein EWE75_14050 [Sphingomonas populi]|uniref:Uncharacterized protein n=1 Tax=Sphingomonas populi TaxID=2484750 RepID=A0A4Q6Y451_9SPHN|nr:hypothetical protein [Sphingomonas populi]RZF63906.1 hypothetical protein EWE75_14050 [Sphingomonas populi]
MTPDGSDPVREIADLYKALVSALALADKLGLSMVGIRLDGAIVEMEKVIADRGIRLTPD